MVGLLIANFETNFLIFFKNLDRLIIKWDGCLTINTLLPTKTYFTLGRYSCDCYSRRRR